MRFKQFSFTRADKAREKILSMKFQSSLGPRCCELNQAIALVTHGIGRFSLRRALLLKEGDEKGVGRNKENIL